MCYSAESSFLGAGLLTVAGIATLRATKTKRFLGLASVPLVFASHQLLEGLVWSSLDEPTSPLNRFAVNAFVLLGFGFWPGMATGFLALAEPERWRRRGFAAVTMVQLYMVWYVAARIPDIPVEVKSGSLAYYVGWQPLHYALFGVAIVLPFFSSLPRAWLLGVALVGSFLTAFAIKRVAAASVWCFFAAWLSLGAYFYIRMLEKGENGKGQAGGEGSDAGGVAMAVGGGGLAGKRREA